ncbi:MAG: triphosphoribosyl-dephospho-CoA synthase, partial [Rectinema subterraneum]|uniref:triphosphoribosyl-dephospho-CoA synthase n=1 Tax=Rectinema subterraneum TaxID=2653714 RepID=UPI003C7DA3E6
LAVGFSWNDALIDTLLVLFSEVEDTNVLGRAGYDGLAYMRSEAKTAIRLGGMANKKGRDTIRTMDAKFIERNISPGGCADLLAITAFLQLIERDI